jgi:hypothetical protein
MAETTFYREKKERDFTVMANHHLRNEKLSWKAKGLLSYMLSLPDDWEIYQSELEKHSKDGRDCLRGAIKELENEGYIVKQQKRNSKGIFENNTFKIIENPSFSPFTGNPSTDNPSTVNPSTENPKLLNTNLNQLLIKQKTNKQSNEQENLFLDFYKEYPKKTNKTDARKVYYSLLKNKVTPELILERLNAYKYQIKKNNTEMQFIRNPARFLRSLEDFEDVEIQEEKEIVVQKRVIKYYCKKCGTELENGVCKKCYALHDFEGELLT